MATEDTRFTGIVARFNNQKGYGFIKPDFEGIGNLYVHQSEIQSEGFRLLYEGEKVEFTVIDDGEKFHAVKVTGPNGVPLDGDHNSGGGADGLNQRNGSGLLRSGGSGGKCYNCGRVGHMARNCDRISGGGGSGGGGAGRGGCYNCGRFGHMARDCPSKRRGGGGNFGVCYNCGLPGHLARDCSRESGGNRLRKSSGGYRFRRSSVGGSKCYNN